MCVSEFPTTGHSLSVKYCPVPCRSGCLAPCCSVCSHATELALSASATINFLHGTFICFLHAHKTTRIRRARQRVACSRWLGGRSTWTVAPSESRFDASSILGVNLLWGAAEVLFSNISWRPRQIL